MATERPQLSPAARTIVAAVPFALAAALVLLFDVLREIPLDYGCGEDAPAGHDAALAAYRSGATLLHLATVGCALGALTVLSAGRGRGPLGIGWPTLVVGTLAVAAALLALLAGDDAGGYVLIPLLLVVIGIVIVADGLGARATALVAVLLLSGAAVWARRAVGAGHTAGVRAALWVLVVLTGAHLLLVYWQGDAPHLC